MAAEARRRILTGEHRCLLDEKGRMNFPAKLRDRMGEEFTVTRWLDDCLIAIPEDKWDKIDEFMSQKGMVEGREASMYIYSAAEDVTPDKQGRILLSSTLREHIAASKELVVVGMGSYAEIWRADAWEKKKKEFKNSKSAAEVLREAGL